MLCVFFQLFLCPAPSWKLYSTAGEGIRKDSKRRRDSYGWRLREWLSIFSALQAEGLCVDRIMQAYIFWVKHAGDAFLLLVFPLISTLTSPSKINLNNFDLLQREAGLFCALFVATWFQSSVAHKNKLLIILSFIT